MDIRAILSFIKVEHTLFSLPFVLIGYIIAYNQFENELDSTYGWIQIDLVWILIAAIGARGLAMALNRIIDREIDAANPRTEERHLASGTMNVRTAWSLAGFFLLMLLIGAWMLNHVALMMAWLPVLFRYLPVYQEIHLAMPSLLGLCLGLAPAGAWVAVAGDVHGWAAITGLFETNTELLWLPTILPICLGVALWITTFDINYARMDIESDKNEWDTLISCAIQ